MVEYSAILRFNFLDTYIQQKCIPGGTIRNWDSYGMKISTLSEDQKVLLADPQTSGGLLVSVDEGHAIIFEEVLAKRGFNFKPFGKLIPKEKHAVIVR